MKIPLAEWNPWWNTKYAFQGIQRELLKDILQWIKRREIVTVIGVRRAGKTTLLFEIIDYLINSERINPQNILFIKADDERISPENAITATMDEYGQLINPAGRKYVFIDEIQEIENWQRTVKRIYDLEKEVKFFISGSNASLMKEELSTLLAGRYAAFELFPFTFYEFLQAKGIAFQHKDVIPVNEKNKIRHFLLEYLQHGAFPEVVLEEDEKIKSQLTKFYFDSIFYRDVIKRKQIRNPAKLEKLTKYFLQNMANLSNFTKIGRLLELTTDSVGEYIKALEDAYLLFIANLFEFSYKKQIINPKKIYCVDIGIRNHMGFTFSEDLGRIYENIVYIALRRKTQEIFYWANKYECDFIVKEGKKREVIQVCFDLKDAREREVNGLIDALQHCKLKEGIIITEDEDGEEIRRGKKIKYIPLWRWLLTRE